MLVELGVQIRSDSAFFSSSSKPVLGKHFFGSAPASS